ncbi:hypothetical protein D3C71_1451010 [compost metagenome]
MVSAFERPFGVDENVGDVLNVAHLERSRPHLHQGVVGGALRIGRIEHQDGSKAGAPSGGQGPVLALDVVNERRAAPGQEGRHHQTDALARAGRREAQHMLGSVVAQIPAVHLAQQHAVITHQPGGAGVAGVAPSRCAVGRRRRRLPRTPDRHSDGDSDGDKRRTRCDRAALQEEARRIGVIDEPPEEEARRGVDRMTKDLEPGRAERRLIGQTPGGPLGRAPDAGEDETEDQGDLAPEDLSSGHAASSSGRSLDGGLSGRGRAAGAIRSRPGRPRVR